MQNAVKVWDAPIRLFHWALVVLFGLSWWSAETRQMELHLTLGVAMLGLIAFRLIWGFAGPLTARFASFLTGPGQVIAQLRGSDASAHPGHSAIGGYSVAMLLLLLLTQVSTGLFATDVDGIDSGPLSFLVSFDTSRAFAEVHEISFNLLLAMAGLHVLAILFYLVVRRRNYLKPMITGRDPQLDRQYSDIAPTAWARVLGAALVAALIGWAASKGFWL